MEKGGLFGRHFGQKLGQKLGKEIERKGQKVGQKFDEKVEQISSTAKTAADVAAQTAKAGLDQLLHNLEEKGLKIKDSQDFLQKIGQSVLDRAEGIREQVAQNPLAPSWIRDVTLTSHSRPNGAKEGSKNHAHSHAHTAGSATHDENHPADAAGSLDEASISQPAQDMQPAPLKEIMEEGLSEHAAEELTGTDGADTDEGDEIVAVEAAPTPRGMKAKTKAKTNKAKPKVSKATPAPKTKKKSKKS
jgi:hypothetical protein